MIENINNSVVALQYEQYERLKEKLPFGNHSHLVELEGKLINNLDEYISAIKDGFRFPYCRTMAGYMDWITDLSWLEKDAYILVIKNYNEFMKNDLNLKEKIILGFKNRILPWWQGEVEKYVVEGKAKPFMVYLVD